MLVLAACWGCGERLEASALSRLVIQPGDLPTGFVRFDHGRQVRADAPEWAGADGSRSGRIDGWKARYRRPGSPATKGPLVIESRADLFESAEGAEDEFGAARAALPGSAGLELELELGEDAISSTSVRGDVRFVTVVWRQANVVATLGVSGFAAGLERQQALALARLQERRVAAEL